MITEPTDSNQDIDNNNRYFNLETMLQNADRKVILFICKNEPDKSFPFIIKREDENKHSI